MFVDHSIVCTVLFGISVPDGFLPGVVGGAITTVIGVSATISGIRDVNDWWRLKTTEPVPIDESVTTDGLIQIQGIVRPVQSSDVLISPIQGDKCVAYEYNIYNQVQGTGDPSIDSGIEYNPFMISDGNSKIYVDPTEESLSLDHETNTVTGGEELLEQVNKERVDIEPPALTDESGLIEDRIELVERNVRVGEKITVVGKANAVTEGPIVDADAAMKPEEEYLIVANDEPKTAAFRTGARGLFVSVVGSVLSIMGLGALLANTTNLLL